MQHPPIISFAPRVTILMGVRNGAAFLPAQLASIAGQTHRNWRLICSDDGSTDDSRAILADFARAHPGQVTLRHGPLAGFSANYMGLIRGLAAAPGYVSFADQDDVWMPDKLSRALDLLGAGADRPALYCGRHQLWYPGLRAGRATPRRRHPCTLENALAENVASGNTVMLNPAAARLARRAAQMTGDVFAHDWWLYLLIAAAQGQVIFDNGPPKVLYRQHGANAIGAGRSLQSQFRRKIGVLRGEFGARVTGNLAALEAVADLLPAESRAQIARYAAARQLDGLSRVLALRRVGPYRQSWQGTLGFWGAASLGRV